jgi:predicted O-methyltransferase YrrM
MNLEAWEKHRNELAQPWALIRNLQRHNQCGSPEPELLFCLSYGLKNRGEIVEIGTYVGTSLTAMALGQKLNGSNRVITAVDLRKQPTLEETLDRAGVRHLANVVVGDSAAVAATWTRPIELLWIDGDHSYKGCARDVLAWENHVLPGGFIAFHDYADGTGVPRAVRETLLAMPQCYRVAADRPLGCTVYIVEKLAASGAAPWVDALSGPAGPAQAPGLRRVWSLGKSAVVSSLRKLRALPTPVEGRRRAG